MLVELKIVTEDVQASAFIAHYDFKCCILTFLASSLITHFFGLARISPLQLTLQLDKDKAT